MAEFMLLLYDDLSIGESLSPEEMQRIIERYKAWGDSLQGEGRLVGSNKLADGEGRVLRRDGSKVRILDGPYSETKEGIAGYFSIRAETYEDAVEIARSCPHMELGGTIEVRRIEVH